MQSAATPLASLQSQKISLILQRQSEKDSVLVLNLPDTAIAHQKFLYASMLSSIAQQLGAQRTKTVSTSAAISQCFTKSSNYDDVLSKQEKEQRSVLAAMEIEREEQMKMHSDGKTTAAAQSGGFHEIEFQWEAEVKSLVSDLFHRQFELSPEQDFSQVGYVDSFGAPEIVKYIQFDRQIQKQVAKNSFSNTDIDIEEPLDDQENLGIQALLKTARTSKLVSDLFPVDGQPRFIVICYPVRKDVVRRVMLHSLPLDVSQRVRMVYNMLVVSFRRHLRQLGVVLDTMSFMVEPDKYSDLSSLVNDIEDDLGGTPFPTKRRSSLPVSNPVLESSVLVEAEAQPSLVYP